MGDKWRLFAYNNIATEIVAILEKRKEVQMEKILKEIEKALNEEMYYSALALTLTLPDICGKAEYPKLKGNRKRYIKWYREYLQDCFSVYGNYTQYGFNEQKCWELRCSILHSGNIETEIKVLRILKNNCFETTFGNRNNKGYDSVNIGIYYFCNNIINVVKQYYEENKEKFHFLPDVVIE